MTKFGTLPVEIIDQILYQACLDPEDVIRLSTVSRAFRDCALEDHLWKSTLEGITGTEIDSPKPASSFYDLHKRHYPYWFLVLNRIWIRDVISDDGVAFIYFNVATKAIEGYPVTARPGPLFRHVDFTGRGRLYLSTPATVGLGIYSEPIIRICLPDSPSRYTDSVKMRRNDTNLVFDLACRIPAATHSQDSIRLWPPLNLPSASGQRAVSTAFSGKSPLLRKPSSRSEAHQGAFRLSDLRTNRRRQTFWRQVTWAALAGEELQATKEKPWQGLWCGNTLDNDFQFIVIRHTGDPQQGSSSNKEAYQRIYDDYDHLSEHPRVRQADAVQDAQAQDPFHCGALEAMRIPGTETRPVFAVPDLSQSGAPFVNPPVASTFDASTLREHRRAVVWVSGYDPADGHGEVIMAAQLKIINHDALALLWPAGEISCFDRVDINRLFSEAQSVGAR